MNSIERLPMVIAGWILIFVLGAPLLGVSSGIIVDFFRTLLQSI